MRLLDIIRIKIGPNRLEHKKLRHQRSGKKSTVRVLIPFPITIGPDSHRDACSVVKNCVPDSYRPDSYRDSVVSAKELLFAGKKVYLH